MSQLAAKLKEAARPGAPPLGFKTHAAEKAPGLVLVARLSVDSLPPAAALKGVDAVLLDAEDLSKQADQLKAAAKSIGETPWGAMVGAIQPGQTTPLKEAHCDFLAFPAEGMPVGILNEDELGKVVVVPATLDDSLAAAINEISVDAAIIRCEEAPLTVGSLLSIVRLTEIIEVPVLVSLPEESGQSELEALRQAGVAGVVLPFRKAHPASRTNEIRQVLDALPVERKKPTRKKAALLPAIGVEEELSFDEED